MDKPNLNDPATRAAALDYEKNVLRIRDEAKRAVAAEKRGEVASPVMLTLRERLALPRAEVRWRIAHLQAVGHRVLLAAQFKAGKTTLAANLTRSVLDGDAFLDTYDVAAMEGVLVLLDFEMSPTQLDDWYGDQKIENDDRLLMIPMRGAASSFNVVDEDVRRQWATLLKSRGVKYLILDCLRPVLDALGLNEHTEAGIFLTALDALLRDAEIPEALVIQHMGHKNERARGDSRMLDWPDVGWTLVRESEDDPASPRFFKAFGRDVDVPETHLAYDEKTRRLTVEGGSRSDAKVAAALADICAFVRISPEAPSGRQVEEAIKLSDHTQKTIRQALHAGVASGVLVAGKGPRGGAAYSLGQCVAEDNALPKPAGNAVGAGGQSGLFKQRA